jgi:hypothetical protein
VEELPPVVVVPVLLVAVLAQVLAAVEGVVGHLGHYNLEKEHPFRVEFEPGLFLLFVSYYKI